MASLPAAPVLGSQETDLAEMAAYLRDALGPRLTALVVGVTNAGEVLRWTRGDVPPSPDVRRRLQTAFEVVGLLLQVESPEAVRSWLLGMNPDLDDRSPALVLAEDPDLVTEAARAFVAAG